MSQFYNICSISRNISVIFLSEQNCKCKQLLKISCNVTCLDDIVTLTFGDSFKFFFCHTNIDSMGKDKVPHSSQLLSEPEGRTGQKRLSLASATRLHIDCCAWRSQTRNKKLIWPALNNFAVFIIAAYGRDPSGKPKINWPLWRSAYYMPIHDPRVVSSPLKYKRVI